MIILDAKRKLCYCCMEIHDVKLVDVDERVTYKGVPVEFTARYEYCELADEFLSDEELIDRNDKAMKRKYELMTSGGCSEEK